MQGQAFRSSINLQFDLQNPRLLDRYMLTPSHSEVLRGILEGVMQQGGHAHLLIGPYGTGKSLLATIVSQLLSQRFSPQWRGRLLQQAEQMDPPLAVQLRGLEETRPAYLPVLINGRTGSLRHIINQSVHRAMHQAGIEIATPNEARSILQTIDRWKKSYPEAYEAFQKQLRSLQVSESDWRARIEDFQEEATQQFKKFYPSVTAGTPWATEHEAYFVDQLDRLSIELKARGYGLFIVYDEFGRFLQSLGGADTLSNMQDLQDFAEFVNRSDNVQFLVVGHKHIRQYAAGSRESIRTEFEKVEKRFRFYSLETDPATFLRLAQEAAAETNEVYLPKAISLESIDTLQGYPLFAEYTAYQLEQGIIRSLYPLHPVAVMLLQHLSNIFGQNERTLFSFLSDNERYSLRDHVHQQSGYYYADQLFDFFGMGHSEHSDQPSLALYGTIEACLDKGQPLQSRIARLLTIWSVTRLTQKQSVTTKFLSFALGIAACEVEAMLLKLKQAKVVRYNAIRDQWELFDGSSIDLNAAVADRMTSVSLSVREMAELLGRHLPLLYIHPYEYNDDMDMLRYADVRFADIPTMKSNKESMLAADDRIWLILYENEDQMEDPAAVMNEVSGPYLAAFPMFTTASVRTALLQFKIMDQLSHDPVFLSQDVRIKNELGFMLQETSMRIKAFVERYFSFEELTWWSGTEQKTVKDLHGLERLVTERLRDRYYATPRISNEAFNRNRISAIQRRALIDVIDRVIQSPSESQLGIAGYGPNYLIYASVLKNKLSFNEEGGVRCEGELARIRDALTAQLDAHPIGRLSDLVRPLGEPPYGIRAAVVPLLFVALLRDRWDQLLFYSHDMLITHLNGASVLELVELADNFEYRYYNWTPEEQRQLLELGDSFALPPEACTSFLHVADALLQWLRQLPKFTQITRQVTIATEWIRDTVRAAEVDPYRHMKALASSGEAQMAAKAELEQFMMVNEAELQRQVLALTGISSLAELFRTLNPLRDQAVGKNSKLLSIDLSDVSDETWEGAIDRLAEHLVGVPRRDWSDATQELFLSQIKYEWQLLHVNEEAAAAIEETDLRHITLSGKSQTLYANVKNMLKYAGRDVPSHEVRQLLIKLLQEI